MQLTSLIFFVEQMEELFSSEDQHEMFGTLKDNTDVILMDGTSSVQKEGEVLTVHYPRAHYLHGAEHVISLFLEDIAKLKPIKVRNV